MREITDQKTVGDCLRDSRFEDSFSFDVGPFVRLFRFDAGEDIMTEGSHAKYLFYMVKGRAKLYLTHSNGRVSLIEFLHAPAYIGEMEFIGVMTETIGVQAVSQCECLALPVAGCKDLLLGDTVFLKDLCTFLGNKSLIQTAAFTKNLAYPFESRLASFILLSSENAVYTEKHTEAAEFLGVSYRHLLYVLARFVREGLLQKTPSGYRIADRAALSALADQMK